MNFFQKIKKYIKENIRAQRKLNPPEAYDLWANTYDEQTDNPVLFLDDIVFTQLMNAVQFEGKSVIDIGCGTGRYWEKILEKNPSELIGADVSSEMLKKLQLKHPGAKTYLIQNHLLNQLNNECCDIIISNLTIGYIKDLEKAFAGWNRILKNTGEILITEFHPEVLKKGALRSFKHKDNLYLIKNSCHSISLIRKYAKKMNWTEIYLIEKTINEEIKHFYQRNNSLDIYNRDYSTPLIYGLYLKK